MFGAMGAPYLTPEQYNQLMQQYNSMYNNMLAQNQNMNMNNGPQRQSQNSVQLLKGRPVSNAEEARASMIDMDGTLFVFPDTANKCVHTKQILMDGSADFKTYVLVEKPKQSIKENESVLPASGEYVLKKDFEEIVNALIQKIKVLEVKRDAAGISNDGATDDEKQPVIPKSGKNG